jgi:hypothetical protein
MAMELEFLFSKDGMSIYRDGFGRFLCKPKNGTAMSFNRNRIVETEAGIMIEMIPEAIVERMAGGVQ